MKNVGQDFPSDDKFLCRISSRNERYNSSKQQQQQGGDASFRVLYYGGATGSVPFLWESQPGTPKHKLSDSPLPPLTPPPHYQSSPLSTSPSLNKKKKKKKKKPSKIFNSIFARMGSKKISSPTSPSYCSLPSTPLHYGRDNKKARLRWTTFLEEEEEDDDEYQRHSPTSTLCFSAGNNNINGSSSSSAAYYYYPIKSLKKVVTSITAGRRHCH